VRWTAPGNKAELAIYPGSAHGSTVFPIGIAGQANNKMMDFFAKRVLE